MTVLGTIYDWFSNIWNPWPRKVKVDLVDEETGRRHRVQFTGTKKKQQKGFFGGQVDETIYYRGSQSKPKLKRIF